jgi:tetratricopeptide (TPR) repeat protein
LAARWRAKPWFRGLTETAPGPIAHEVRAFAEVLEAGEGGGALLQLRDTVETLLKFIALMIARDLITHGKAEEADVARRALFSRLMHLGQWVGALRTLANRVNAEPDRFLTSGLAALALTPAVQSSINRFVDDRNEQIGHGAFSRDPRETATLIERVAFGEIGGAATIFAAFDRAQWPHLAMIIEGSDFVLSGADSVRDWHNHAHHAGCEKPELLPVHAVFLTGRLDLTPFVAGRVCDWCGHQDVFLFDTVYDRKNGGRFDFMDYVQGHKILRRDSALGEIASNISLPSPVSSGIDHGPLSQSGLEVLESAVGETRYVSPLYLREIIIDAINSGASSLTWVQAPGHTGKTIFARAIADPRADRPDPLPYDDLAVAGIFIKREWRSELPLLRVRLTNELMRVFDIPNDRRELLPQLRMEEEDKPAAFARLLARALEMNRRSGRINRLLLVIDGLDELAPTKTGQAFADFIPAVSSLPEGVHVLLTSRRPGDSETPDRFGTRLLARLGKTAVREIDLRHQGYLAVMRQYACDVLKRDLGDATFDLLIEKSESLFLYFSFLVDQMRLRRLSPGDLPRLAPGAGLFRQFLANFKRELGWERLAEEAELLVLALAAEELAHDWAVGAGRVEDHSGPVIVDDEEWRGIELNEVAGLLDRLRPDGSVEGLLLYAIFRLKAVIGIHRGGTSQSRFRLWLKGLAQAIRDTPDWLPRLRLLHTRAAMSGLEVARSVVDAPKENQIAIVRSWSRAMPRILGHAALSGSQATLGEVRDDDAIIEMSNAVCRLRIEEAGGLKTAERASNVAITILCHRARYRKDEGLHPDEAHSLAVALGNRSLVRQQSGELSAAIADTSAAIEALRSILEGDQTAVSQGLLDSLGSAYNARSAFMLQIGNFGGALSDSHRAVEQYDRIHELNGDRGWAVKVARAASFNGRGMAKRALNDFRGALADLQSATVLLQYCYHEAGGQFPVKDFGSLASAIANKGVCYLELGDVRAAIDSFDEAIPMMREVQAALGDRFSPQQMHALIGLLANRASARRTAGRLEDAMSDYDTALALIIGPGEDGVSLLPSLAHLLAGVFGGRAELHTRAGQSREAIDNFSFAIDVLDRYRMEMREDFPLQWACDLAGIRNNRGLALWQSGDRDNARVDLVSSVEMLESYWSALGIEFPERWVLALVHSYMNAGMVFAGSPGDAAFAYGNAVTLIASELLRSGKTTMDTLDLFTQALEGAATSFELAGNVEGAAQYREWLGTVSTELDNYKAEPAKAEPVDPREVVTDPMPPALLPGGLTEWGASELTELVGHKIDGLRDALALRPFPFGGGAQAVTDNCVIVGVLFGATDRPPGVIDFMIASKPAFQMAVLRRGLSFADAREPLQGQLSMKRAISWAALGLAGPWAHPTRRVLGADDEIPWRAECPRRPALPIIEAPRVSQEGSDLSVKAMWLRGRTLAQGEVRISPDGDIEILSETDLAKDLPIWTWVYEGPFRVPI